MSEPAHLSLVVAAIVAASAALAYLVVGRVLFRRAASSRTSTALRMFSLWWVATGINIFLGSISIGAAAFGQTSLSLQLSYAILQRLLLAVGLTGLVHYLLVMVRGRVSTPALVAFYGAFFAVLLATVYASEPIGVYVGDWRTDLVYAQEPASRGILQLLNFAWLVGPPVGLSIAALLIGRRLPASETPLRNRLTLVGTALIVWWIVAVVAGQREALGQEQFQVFNRLLGLSMSLVVLAAYQPPAWLRRYIELP